jgi:peptidoglycan/LPS O-acetylase OafA/YrhL
VISSFFAFVIGAWAAVRVAGIKRAEPAILHGAISWVVAVFVMIAIAGLSGAIFNGWYTSLAPTPAVPAVPGAPVDPKRRDRRAQRRSRSGRRAPHGPDGLRDRRLVRQRRADDGR